MSQVSARLYVGSMSGARNLGLLMRHGITHVLNCCTLPNAHEGRLKYHRLDLTDSVADLPRMGDAIRDGVRFMHAAIETGGAVLVHCHRGISRSCTLAMAYLIWADRLSADEAFEELRRARRVCDPNLGFLCSLKDWERQVLAGADAPLDDSAPAGVPPPREGGGAMHRLPALERTSPTSLGGGVGGGGGRPLPLAQPPLSALSAETIAAAAAARTGDAAKGAATPAAAALIARARQACA